MIPLSINSLKLFSPDWLALSFVSFFFFLHKVIVHKEQVINILLLLASAQKYILPLFSLSCGFT